MLGRAGTERHSAVTDFLAGALAQAVHHVLLALVLVAAAALAALLLVPRTTEPLTFD